MLRVVHCLLKHALRSIAHLCFYLFSICEDGPQGARVCTIHGAAIPQQLQQGKGVGCIAQDCDKAFDRAWYRKLSSL